ARRFFVGSVFTCCNVAGHTSGFSQDFEMERYWHAALFIPVFLASSGSPASGPLYRRYPSDAS
ncbi:MAG: hypothetical protein IIZ39_08325, partial [Blautia sp.]|nr:hypothetical protein [Blautia sp.]